MRKMKKLVSMILALSLSASLLATTAFADTSFTFTYPEEPQDVSGSTVLTTMTQRAGSEINLIFGMNVVAGNSFNGLLNLAGTVVSDNPDPYIWNFNYLLDDTTQMMPSLADNIRAGAQPLPDGTYYVNVGNELANANGLYESGGANQVYANPVDEMGGVGHAVGYRVDVITGFNSLLIDQIDLVHSWKEGDAFYQEGDENYSPLIIDVQTGSVTSRLYAWAEMGQAISAYLEAHPDKTVRYGDPYTIAVNLEEFSAGIPYYIASLIAEGKVEKKTTAFVAAIDGYTLTCIDPSNVPAGDASGNNRTYYDIFSEVHNFNFLEGAYTLADLMNEGVDLIILGNAAAGFGGDSASTSDKQAILAELVNIGYGAEDMPLIMDKNTYNVTIGTNGFNYAPTTPLLVPYVQTYAYMDEIAAVNPAINPVAMVQYMFDEFCHVTGEAAADVALYYIGSKWDSVDEDYDQVPDLANYTYDKAAVASAIQAGITYALSGEAEANGNTLIPAVRENDNAYLILTKYATAAVPSDGHDYITLTINGQTKYLDLTDLAATEGEINNKAEQAQAAEGGNGGGNGGGGNNAAAANNYTSTRTEYQAIIEYYNSGTYGYGDDLQTTLQKYADHMVAHVWTPDTSVKDTYGYGLSGSKPAAPAAPPVTAGFRDVAGTAWYAEYVAYASEHGIMNGNSDGTFNPEGNLTRAEMCQILYNMAGTPEAGAPAYGDVSGTAWYAAAVAWCCENGIAAGRSDTEFAPTAAITREEVADFLYHYASSQGKDTPAGDLSAFTDAGSISASKADAMSWAVGVGIINGSTATTLSPNGTATRAEIATMMMRFCEAA